ncbi:gephyrin-like molybdotransferase Glp [Undibacterium sp. Di24W]|uniref:molybdopterin molybdotransferase MoeA n=1 Tax=Undibacterium sp. Di24W TaxID=3413033 RepID=UPI003BEF8C47
MLTPIQAKDQTQISLQEVLQQQPSYEAHALSVNAAQQIIQAFVHEVQETEQVNLFSAFERVLAHDIASPIDVPAHDNSAMDGFAFDGTALQAGGSLELRVVGHALAGHPFQGQIQAGECIRIMTGAVMPAHCDTVVPQEFTESVGQNQIRFAVGKLQLGDNRRFRGEDLSKGKIALGKGKHITPADLGLLASLGLAQIEVKRKVKVAYFSTGDEIRSLGESLDAGSVYDSNRYTIYGMLQRLGCEMLDMGVVADNPDQLEQALRHACEHADAIITSGGVSVGAADYTKQIMAKLGEVEFWTIGMRPGRPMAFGRIHSNGHSAFLFGLPGNPVAVMVTFYFFAQQALHALMGVTPTPVITVSVKSKNAIRKRQGRTEYQRGIVTKTADGLLEVAVTGSQGSGILRSMSEANCMIILDDACSDVGAGDLVNVLLFDGLT